MSMVDAVRANIEQLPENLQGSVEAAAALTMAERIDNGRGSPSQCMEQLLKAWASAVEKAPPKRERTPLDDLTDDLAKRRRARKSAAKA